jgi:hypothetical protein
LLAKQPGHKAVKVLIAGCPGVVANAGKFDIDRLRPSLPERTDSTAAAFDRNSLVLITMSNPDRNAL